jgi:hypothetical protein
MINDIVRTILEALYEQAPLLVLGLALAAWLLWRGRHPPHRGCR